MIESKCGQQITFDIHKLSLRRGDSQVYLDFEKKLPDKIVYLKFNNMCNLNCSYCFQKNEEKSKYLAINIEKNLIDTLVDAHSIYLFGGEPFLKINYKNIEQIVELCLKMNKNFLLSQMGYLMKNILIFSGNIMISLVLLLLLLTVLKNCMIKDEF